jgi:soluble lytic murein transglycosylase-like protein
MEKPMPKQSTTPVRPPAPAFLKALASAAVLLLSVSAGAWAQVSDSRAPSSSVDEAFSTYQQALSATANDLLGKIQRPQDMARPEVEASLGSDPGFVSALRVEGTTGQNIQWQKAIERVQRLRPMLERILREEGVPQQMAAIVLIESGGLTTALSSKGARGLWQIMPDTARRYGLVVTTTVDERLDPYQSTHAAARYLRDLYTQFGNWPLALAAYNAGEDTVQRALDRASGRDFRSIAHAGMLPLETQNYVPAVLSAIGLIAGTGKGRNSGAEGGI